MHQSQRRMYALGRLKKGQMNGTEKAYAEYLDGQMSTGAIQWYRFEGVKLRLADNNFYTPDFAVMDVDGAIELHEVKGFWVGDAKTKITVAAEMYPFRFFVVKKQAKKDGGGWEIKEV